MRWTNLLINAALFVCATVLSVAGILLVGEVTMRLKTRADPHFSPWNVFDPERGWALRPGEYSYFDVDESRASRISINSLGLRNPPVSLGVPPGRTRLSIVGDSFMFGALLNDSETVVGRLRDVLPERYDVVNLGVEGYGTGTEALLLEDLVKRGYAIGDDVVLSFFTNDILDNLGRDYSTGAPRTHIPRFWVDSTGALRHTRPESLAVSLWGRKLSRGLMFYRYLRTRAANLMLSHPGLLELAGRFGFRPDLPRLPGVVEGFYSPGWEDRWRTTEQILDYMSRLVRERLRTRLTVVFVPSPFQVVGGIRDMVARRAHSDSVCAAFVADPDRPQHCLSQFCARSHLVFIDATGPLRQAARTRSPYFVFEGHLNPFGTRVVAAAIREGMKLPARR